jgi:GSH-dependent disulfide-bond oxidoreductase
MLELYHWEPNTFYLKPLVALAEKGVAYTARYFDPTQFEQFGAAFPLDVESRLHLEREGPVLIHDGALISSSYFLLEYIAEAFPGPALLPADAYDRYRARAWGQISALSLASAVSALGCARYLAPILRSRPVDSLRSQIDAIEPLERRAAWAAVLEGGAEAQLAAARNQLAGPVGRIEATLANSPWLAGAQYSIADIDVFAMFMGLPELAPDLLSATASPHIMAFLQRMRARPAVRAALALSRTGHPEQAYVPGSEPSRWG